MIKPKLERRSILECDNQDIVKKTRKSMEDLKADWLCKEQEGILSWSFVNRIYAMPEAVFISEFMELKPASAKEIEALIRSGLITGNCYDCTDTEEYNEAWVYRMNDKTYYIDLSHWSDMPFEEQAAKQIFQLYQNEKERI